MSKDWLAENHTALMRQARTTTGYLNSVDAAGNSNSARMGLSSEDPQGRWYFDVFFPAYTSFDNVYRLWESPATRTPVVTKELFEAEAVFCPLYRQLYTGCLKNNPLVTDDDLVAMGLPAHNDMGSERHPAPVPATRPVLTVDTSVNYQLGIHYRDAEKLGKGKPEGVHGLELKWVMADEPPATEEEFIHSTFDTHTPIVLKFDLNRQGARVHLIARWENTRGEKGPWCTPVSAMVP